MFEAQSLPQLDCDLASRVPAATMLRCFSVRAYALILTLSELPALVVDVLLACRHGGVELGEVVAQVLDEQLPVRGPGVPSRGASPARAGQA